MSESVTIRDRFRVPPCPEAPFNNPSCVSVQYRLDNLTAQIPLNIKTSGNVNRGIDAVYAVKVDNTYGSKEMRITAQDSNDFVVIPAGCSGMFALYSRSCVFVIEDFALVSPNRRREILFYDTPQTYYTIQSRPTGSNIFQGFRNLSGLPSGSGLIQPVIPVSGAPVFSRQITGLKVALDNMRQSSIPTAIQVVMRYGPNGNNFDFFARTIVSTTVYQSFLLFDFDFSNAVYMRSDYSMQLNVFNSGAMIEDGAMFWNVLTTSDDDGI